MPAVSVAEFPEKIIFPLKLIRPAPPEISITFVAAVVPWKNIPPSAFSSPVVITIWDIRDVVAFVPLKEMSPVTVAEPALIFQELFRVLVVG